MSNDQRATRDAKPASGKARCAAITREGDQCRNPAKPGTKRCPIHSLKQADPKPNPRTAW